MEVLQHQQIAQHIKMKKLNILLIVGIFLVGTVIAGITFTRDVNVVGDLNVTSTVVLESLKGTYTGGNATVCVYDNGTLYASDGGC